MRRYLCLGWAVVLSSAMPAGAFWFGNPARSMEKGMTAFEMMYDTSNRDIKLRNNQSSTVELDSHRFCIQGRTAMNDVAQFYGRLLPGLGRINVENNSFDPHMWGGGLGLQLAPPEPIGIVHFGVLGGGDFSAGMRKRPQGQTGNDKVDWTEGYAALGASVSPIESVSVYGGASLIKDYINFDMFDAGSNSVVKSHLKNDRVFGGFLGAEFCPNKSWGLGAEMHFGNETLWGLMAQYVF